MSQHNVFANVSYASDPTTFLLITFLIAAMASMYEPIIMMGQRRQSQKNSKRLAKNLKVKNEILLLHQSIAILVETQPLRIIEDQKVTQNKLRDIGQGQLYSNSLFYHSSIPICD